MAKAQLRLCWRGAGGKPLEDYAALQKAVSRAGLRLLAATNAGIFEPALIPSGLHPDALYLDGYISTLHVPFAERPAKPEYECAGMIAVVAR